MKTTRTIFLRLSRTVLLTTVVAVLAAGCANPWARDSAKLENQDSDTALQIKAALMAEPDLAGSAIDVQIEDDEAVLTGFVGTEAQSREAVRIARGQQGVSNVVNRLVVK
ncbi:MAG TPA: BON domain-containing protein [Wenzhouxiangellaceae bacterium]|nr:BON domain-containing protein [Wenzhouxiangellaceae bacterium]